MPPEMQTDSESAFFEHLSSLSAEYEAWFQNERMTLENRHLRWALAELSANLSDVQADADHVCPSVVRGIHREARHGAMEEDALQLEEVRDFQDLGLCGSHGNLMGYGNTNSPAFRIERYN
eukprot:s4100_g6.t2